MATSQELIGLGLPSVLANLLANHLQNPFTVQGGSAGSATPMPGPSRVFVVTASNAGSGCVLPLVNGDINQSNRTDEIKILNLLSASIVVYAANTAQGSLSTMYVSNASVAGLTGVSVASGGSLILIPVSVSTWMGIRGA